ncbi:MAG: thioesterase [Myxococcales bacterium]
MSAAEPASSLTQAMGASNVPPRMELTGHREFRVASYHIGFRGTARPSAIMGFLEEAAGEHAMSWKLSIFDLMPRGMTWVLARYHLKLLRPVRHGEVVDVTTWPSGRTSVFATRDFEVAAADGSPVALASTSWAILDMATKRPINVTDVVPPEFVLPRRVLGQGFSSLPRLDDTQVQRQVELPVMRRDLDMNDHVNHIVYAQWGIESVDPAAVSGLRPTEIEISYRAEARWGDRVVSAMAPTAPPEDAQPPAFIHRISNAVTGAELARLRTVWGR